MDNIIQKKGKNMNWKKIWSFAEKHRFSIIAPVLGASIWLVAVGCTPMTNSPVSGQKIDAKQLQIEFDTTMAKYEYAKDDLEHQAEMQAKFTTALMSLASGQVANIAGLINLALTSGLIGFGVDHVRKNGVIAGLKRNNTPA